MSCRRRGRGGRSRVQARARCEPSNTTIRQPLSVETWRRLVIWSRGLVTAGSSNDRATSASEYLGTTFGSEFCLFLLDLLLRNE